MGGISDILQWDATVERPMGASKPAETLHRCSWGEGFGAILGNKWCAGAWPDSWVAAGITSNITLLELFLIDKSCYGPTTTPWCSS